MAWISIVKSDTHRSDSTPSWIRPLRYCAYCVLGCHLSNLCTKKAGQRESPSNDNNSYGVCAGLPRRLASVHAAPPSNVCSLLL